jgi:hypothetical protein
VKSQQDWYDTLQWLYGLDESNFACATLGGASPETSRLQRSIATGGLTGWRAPTIVRARDTTKRHARCRAESCRLKAARRGSAAIVFHFLLTLRAQCDRT